MIQPRPPEVPGAKSAACAAVQMQGTFEYMENDADPKNSTSSHVEARGDKVSRSNANATRFRHIMSDLHNVPAEVIVLDLFIVVGVPAALLIYYGARLIF